MIRFIGVLVGSALAVAALGAGPAAGHVEADVATVPAGGDATVSFVADHDLALLDVVDGLQGGLVVPGLGAGLGAVDELLGALRHDDDVTEDRVESFRQLDHWAVSLSRADRNASRIASRRVFSR